MQIYTLSDIDYKAERYVADCRERGIDVFIPRQGGYPVTVTASTFKLHHTWHWTPISMIAEECSKVDCTVCHTHKNYNSDMD